MKSLLMIVFLGTVASTAQAVAEQSSTTLSQIEARQTERLSTLKANQWGLETAEWQRFEQLMQGPLGIYSPNLDPLSALGIEAKTEQERARYAELQVKMEATRVSKLLAYQNAYDQAFKRLHPDLLPVNLVSNAASPQMSSAKSSERLAVFVKLNCPACEAQVKSLQQKDESFDIYLVGSKNSDDSIRAWALKVGIATQKVHSRQITLNHDTGRWISIGGTGTFPAVLRQINGRWVRQ